jgi:hypothetical protein
MTSSQDQFTGPVQESEPSSARHPLQPGGLGVMTWLGEKTCLGDLGPRSSWPTCT